MRPLYDRYRLVKKHIASREAKKSLQQDTTADSKYWLVPTTLTLLYTAECAHDHVLHVDKDCISFASATHLT